MHLRESRWPCGSFIGKGTQYSAYVPLPVMAELKQICDNKLITHWSKPLLSALEVAVTVFPILNSTEPLQSKVAVVLGDELLPLGRSSLQKQSAREESLFFGYTS